MKAIIRMAPGWAGALAAFIMLKILDWMGSNSLFLDIVLFFAAYVVVQIAVDRAMKAYGETHG